MRDNRLMGLCWNLTFLCAIERGLPVEVAWEAAEDACRTRAKRTACWVGERR